MRRKFLLNKMVTTRCMWVQLLVCMLVRYRGSESIIQEIAIIMEVGMAKKPHVLAVPFPAQGHVKPLMKLCRGIAKRGIKVTFVNLDSIHDKLLAAAKARGDEDEDEEEDNMVLVSIPDGLGAGDDPNDTLRMLETLRSSLPGSLTRLIERINCCNPDERVSCLIADITIGWVMEIAEKAGVEEALPFCSFAAASIALAYRIPMLLQDGILDSNGGVTNDKIILSDGIPAWGKYDVTWSFPGNLEIQNLFFEFAKRTEKITKSKLVLINTCSEIEPAACEMCPNLWSLGPLLEINTPESTPVSYNFHPEDESCLNWLDCKPHGSVIYVSFGSLAVFSQRQFDELALGLELSGRKFLWVVRSGLANGSRAVYPSGYLDRVREVGKIVKWAPQEKVLSHPSVACFLSHCGWNSTLEGLSMGVRFLCWPSFGDQFHNQNYICYKWETGLRIEHDEDGIRSRFEIKEKIDKVFSLDNLRANALKHKELCRKTLEEGGSSYKNFERFIYYLRK